MTGFYLIKRGNAADLHLHPFLQRKEAERWDVENAEPVTVRYGSEVTEEQREQFLYDLYVKIDRGVDSWIVELKYIPRLLSSAGAFLVIYFFLSFVIRDPIPVLDELLGAAVGAAAVYLWTASRSKRSNIALKKRIEIKDQFQQTDYAADAQIALIESRLALYDAMPAIELADRVCGEDGGLEPLPLENRYEEIAEYVRRILEYSDRHKKILRRLAKVNTERERTACSANLFSLASKKSIDLPLVALYTAMRVN
jgi:hypothetical protein